MRSPPVFIKPQLSRLLTTAPDGGDWTHELKYDGYRMHARLDHKQAKLLTRTGLDWTRKYPLIADAIATLPAATAYLDGELCGVRPDGTTSFSLIQNASDGGNQASLVFFLFDLLYVDGRSLMELPLIDRKDQLEELLSVAPDRLRYSDHHIGNGPQFLLSAGLQIEGGRDCLQAARRAIRAGQSWAMGQDQVPQP